MTWVLKDQKLQEKLEFFIPKLTEDLTDLRIRFPNNRTLFITGEKDGLQYHFEVPVCMLKEIEVLKPYVWYPRAKFDGNPHKYLIAERVPDYVGQSRLFLTDFCPHDLYVKTAYFMYLEHAPESEE